MMKKMLLSLSILLISTLSVFSQQPLDYKPKVLMVTAHPDDDALFQPLFGKPPNYLTVL